MKNTDHEFSEAVQEIQQALVRVSGAARKRSNDFLATVTDAQITRQCQGADDYQHRAINRLMLYSLSGAAQKPVYDYCRICSPRKFAYRRFDNVGVPAEFRVDSTIRGEWSTTENDSGTSITRLQGIADEFFQGEYRSPQLRAQGRDRLADYIFGFCLNQPQGLIRLQEQSFCNLDEDLAGDAATHAIMLVGNNSWLTWMQPQIEARVSNNQSTWTVEI